MQSYLVLMLGASLISFSAVFVKLSGVPPVVSAFYRMLIGGACLFLFCFLRRRNPWVGWPFVLTAAASSIFLTLDLGFWHTGIHMIGVGLATILTNMQVLCLALFGAIFLHETLNKRYLISVATALAGLYLLVGVDHGNRGEFHFMGSFAALFAAFCYAAYLLMLRRLQGKFSHISSMVTMAWVSLACAITLLIYSLGTGTDLSLPSWQSFGWLFILGVVCQATAWVLISRNLPQVPASTAGLILLMQPALSFVWDVVIFSRPTAPLEVLGAVVALAAIYMGSMQKSK